MKQHLDTIPVWDAYKTDCECPLCRIRTANEAMYVDNFLGGSVMEPDTRIEVNKKGFCTRHNKMMYDAGNRLGLALMSHTYLKETIEKLKGNAQRANAEAEGLAKKPLSGLFGGKGGKKDGGAPADEARAIAEGCILCERLNHTMERYVYTLLYMWKHESEFKKAFELSRGFCLVHYAEVMKAAPGQLSGKDLSEFTEILTRMELENLERLEKELEWFTLKFDYRNQDKPWGASQDAVERAVNKLRGTTVE